MNTDQINKTILLNASLPRVWRALSDSGEFESWFGMRFSEPFSPGATLHGVITPTTADPEVAAAQKPYEGLPCQITIVQMQPERLFSFRWHPYAIEPNVDYSSEPTTLVEFTLEEAHGGVRLTVTESGFDRIPLSRRAKAFAANEQGWSTMVNVIETYVVHGTQQ